MRFFAFPLSVFSSAGTSSPDRSGRLRLLTSAVAVAAGAAAFGAARLPAPLDIAALGVAALVSVVVVWTGLFRGVMVGILAAAGLLLLARTTGLEGLPRTAVTGQALIALAWTLGALARELGRRGDLPTRIDELFVPVAGTLGVLRAEAGRLRIEDELCRARTYARPLSAVVARFPATEGPVTDLGTGRRGVARLLQSQSPVGAVPLEMEDGTLALLLPEHDQQQAEAVREDLDRSSRTRTAVGATGSRDAIGRLVDVTWSVVVLEGAGSAADDAEDVLAELTLAGAAA